MDVGANRGVHVRYLLEPSKFPRSRYHSTYFAPLFGAQAQHDPTVCSILFEPNMVHAQAHKDLIRRFNTSKIHSIMAAAAATSSDHVVMYDHRGDSKHAHWTFGARRPSWRPVNVTAVDLAEFVATQVVGRRVPEPSYAGAPPPAVIMKVDVEGDELVLFERLLSRGVLCDINVITYEYHEYLQGRVRSPSFPSFTVDGQSYEAHEALWDVLLSHQQPGDEDPHKEVVFARLRSTWAKRNRTKEATSWTRCPRTRFVARDEEEYLAA